MANKGGRAVPTFCDEKHVVKEVVALGCGLQQRDEDRVLLGVSEVPQVLDDLEGCGAVQPSGDFVLYRQRSRCQAIMLSQ